MGLAYEDFYIHVGWPNELGRYPTQVVHSPQGETRQPTWQENKFRLSVNQNILDFLAELIAEPEEVEQLGRTLHEFLFPSDVYEIFQRCREDKSHGLRIRLRIDPEELSLLPWEYCYDQKIRQFLALERQTPIVRYIAEGFSAPASITMPRPVKVLAVLAAPRDQPALDMNQEQAGLRQALKNVPVELHFLEHASIEKLHETLLEVEPHILHFSGHGVVVDEQGALALENPQTGNTDPLTARQMRSLLNRMGISLAVLNACETARHSTRDALMGVAQALVREEIPAVIAMQFLVSETVALMFTRRLYEFLFRGDSLEKIVTETRVGIDINTNQDRISWGIPVLFMRAKDGRLWLPDQTTAGSSLDSLVTADLRGHRLADQLTVGSTAGILLKKVHRQWVEDVLSRSIPNAERRIEFVFRRKSDQAALDRDITSIFDDLEHALLILGAPGSGKTIALCELGRDLIERAAREKDAPLPVILRLATWRQGLNRNLKDWIHSELKSQYGLGQNHLDEIEPRRLNVLLDGLDEVRPDDQPSCIQAINEYCAQTGWIDVVITCRESDYRDLVEDGNKLNIPSNQVIQVAPLESERVTTFLDHLGSVGIQVDQLYPLLANECCPLMADVILQTYEGLPADRLAGVKTTDIWEKYVARKFDDETTKRKLSDSTPPFSPKATQKWLRWLAEKLGVYTQDQHRFFVEAIQPGWLPIIARVVSYLLTSLALLAPAYLLTQFTMRAGVPVYYGEAGVRNLLENYLTITIPLASLWIAALIWTLSRRSASFLPPILMGCLTGVVFGSMIWIAYADMPLLAVVGGGISAVIFALLVRLAIQILGFSDRQIVCVKRRRWDWRKAGIGLIIGIVFVMIISAVSDITRAIFFEGMGLTAAFQETVSLNTVVWWNWGLPGLLSLSAFFLFIFGLGWGDVVLREEVDLPNQGIKDSGWNGLIVASGGLLAGIAFSLAIGLPCYLGFGFKSSTGICFGGDPTALLSGLRLGLGYGLILGFVFGMTQGGFAWMRHYLVRVLFCLDGGQIPWRLVDFLQYCSRLGFLRSVGGGFEFIDQELKAHFARTGVDEQS